MSLRHSLNSPGPALQSAGANSFQLLLNGPCIYLRVPEAIELPAHIIAI
jgi:hypothetical protein